ncbi:MAG: response regulator [Alphaproteobacteria bacterium]|nr:MAG: response regulator [Alphaproteobacteria bacterium]
MASSYNNLKVLIVEDSADARITLKSMLLELEITQVFEAADGMEALEFIDSSPDLVDLIVCDWNMPMLTGVEFLRQVRSVYADMPFLMVTGRNDIDSVIEAKQSGVTAYITKPFSFHELQSKLDKVIQCI